MQNHQSHEALRLTRRKFLAAALGSAGLGLLAACSSSAPSPSSKTDAPAKAVATQPAPSKPAGPKVITISQGSEILNLDPHNDTTEHARTLLSHMFDTLVERSDDMKLAPGLAESWKVVDDKTWEFKLRKGVKWHDGQEFTSEDVKFTIDRVMNKDNNLPVRSMAGPLEAVEIVDSHTFKLITAPRYPLTPASLTRVFIIPAKAFKEMGKDAFIQKPVGTGAYKFVEWIKDDHLTVEKNPNSWRGEVKIDQVTFKPIPESATRIAALVSGASQLITPVDAENVSVIEQNPDLKVETCRGIRHMWIGMNTFEKPLDDIRVRRAIVHAIDVDGLIKTLMEGRVYRTPSAFGGPEIFGHDPNIKPYAYDPELSKKLLAEAGYPNGFELDFDSMSGRLAKDVETAQAVAGQLEKVGIKVKLQIMEFGAYRGVYTGKKAKGLHMWSSGTTTLDGDGVVYLMYHSKGRGIYYNTPKLDDLIDQARSTLDEQKRLQLYSEVQKILAEDVPVIPMWQFQNIYGISKRVKGFVPRTDERIYAHKLDIT